MRHAIRVLIISMSLFTLFATGAHAQSVVVPPLVARGAPSMTASNMTALIASELEFMGEFEEINQLDKRPPQLGPNCLGSTPCLAGIAKKGGSSNLLGGKVTKYGEEFEVVLTYMKDSRIVRTVKRRMSTDPIAVADEVAALVRHAVTGVDPAAKAAEDRVSGFDGGGVALMDDEEDEEDDDALLMAAPAAAVAVSTADPLGDEDDFIDEDPEEDGFGAGAAVGAAAGATVGAAAASRGARTPSRTPAPAPAPAPAPPVEDSFDPDAITFGGSADDISFGSAATMIQVDGPPEDPIDDTDAYDDEVVEPEPRQTRQPKRPRTKTPKRIKPKRSKPKRQAPSRSDSGGIEVTGTTGYARFQSMNFITFGAEAAYEVMPNIAVVGGLEAHTTKRSLPQDQVPAGEPAEVWNNLMAINLGAVYRLSDETLRPYVGAGIQMLPSYVEAGGGVAFGFRALAGADYQITDKLSARAGLGTGLWAGSQWYKIPGLMNTGFVVSLNTGLTMAF
jgi:hypothetical protein